MYFENPKVKEEVDEFNQIKCPVPKCADIAIYNNVSNLKKHLKEKHNRFFWYVGYYFNSQRSIVIYASNIERLSSKNKDCLQVINWIDI